MKKVKSDKSYDDLKQAVYKDHVKDCQENCDIKKAYDAGFPLIAVHLLMDATSENKHLNNLLEKDSEAVSILGESLVQCDEWAAWKKHFDQNKIQCPRCNAWNFSDEFSGESPRTCGACRLSFV